MSNEQVLNNGRINFPENKDEFYASVEQEIAEKQQKPRVKGLTPGQQDYLDTINASIITLCTGPAGSGKTWIPVVRAVELLKESKYRKLIITRPNIPCGDDMGHLPGDINEKMAPFMKPILDILEEFIEPKELREYLASGVIEICPLLYMRGRTLNNCIMILDEAQNAKWEQIVMFMTRIGDNSKIIISGDEDQKDTEGDAYRQTVTKWERRPYVDGVNVVRLTEDDIVRNKLIRKILKKMGDYEPNFRYPIHRT
jgi:phosphate starvation-inducible PhoH-like protein